jgi:hypothetical protein
VIEDVILTVVLKSVIQLTLLKRADLVSWTWIAANTIRAIWNTIVDQHDGRRTLGRRTQNAQ